MGFDERIQKVIKYQVEGRGGKINPKDDFKGFILDIKTIIKKSLPKKSNIEDNGGLYGAALQTSRRGKSIRNQAIDEIHRIFKG